MNNNQENELVAAVTALAVDDNRNPAAEEVLSDWRSKLAAAEPTEQQPVLVENCFTSI